MKKRLKYAPEGLIGAEARVVSKLGPQDEAQYLVKIRGELWSANSRDDFKPGDVAQILSVDGLKLLIGKTIEPSSIPSFGVIHAVQFSPAFVSFSEMISVLFSYNNFELSSSIHLQIAEIFLSLANCLRNCINFSPIIIYLFIVYLEHLDLLTYFQ
jgi:hypothetical protein